MKPLGKAILILCLLAVLGFVGTAGYGIYRFYAFTANVDKQIHQKVEQVAALFRGLFHETPRLVVNHETTWGQTAPIAEFAVVEREGEFSQEWKQTRFLSTKRVVIRAHYLAKAGFDLSRDFYVDVDRRTGAVTAFLPPAKIFSVELKSDLEVHGENGLVNWLTDADIAEALKYFRAQVTAEAEKSGLPAEAEAQALRRLEELAREAGTPVRFGIVREPAGALDSGPVQKPAGAAR